MNNPKLLVGTATLPVMPPLGIDMLGFVNRPLAGRGYGQPMEVNAFVVQSGDEKVAILAVDMVLCPVPVANRIRQKIATALNCPRKAVLMNLNHSHALPGFISDYKLGGEFDGFSEVEIMFSQYVEEMMVSAAQLANGNLAEAEMIFGSTSVEGITVNRRERTADGRTILGWNPDGICDTSVQSVCFKRSDGSVIGTIVNFACHPVIVGRDVAEYSSDYVGAIRSKVKQLLGGDCLFLQGAAGNILPLEAFHEEKGKEVEFGHFVALKAVEALMQPLHPETTIHKKDFGSVTPISMYRKQIKSSNPASQLIASAEELVHFPLQQLPTQEELETEILTREIELAKLKQQSASRMQTNPIQYHLDWARTMLKRMHAGTYSDPIIAPIQAIRIGPLAICAAPGEIFTEIGLAVKSKSPAKMTLYAGYSNGLLGYFATAEEYPYRGYEPYVSHRGFAQPAAFDSICESLLVDIGSRLLHQLFSFSASTH